MHAILVTMGTDGDVIPFVGVGEKLLARGYRVTLVTNEPFQRYADAAGFDFRPLISAAEHHRLFGDPDFWHPLKGPLIGARLGAELIGRQYELLADLARSDCVLVANPGVVAARIIHDALKRPLATLLLQPGMIASTNAPPIMPGGLSLPRDMPKWMGRGYWRLLDALGDQLLGQDINRLRASLGLSPMRRIFQWWLSPQRVIGLFPDWYGPPQDDWPPQVRLAGFPMVDGERDRLSADVLAFCDAGPPPIAFTLGTGMMHAATFFRAAVAACRSLGARGLLLTKHRNQLPDALPSTVRHYDFVPFLQLLPHCSAIVHHGGIGTVAKAMATATPQLILPLGWDQPDNAARVKRLGTGDWLPRGERDGRGLARALKRIVTPTVAERCRAVAGRFQDGDSLDIAAGWIEELAADAVIR